MIPKNTDLSLFDFFGNLAFLVWRVRATGRLVFVALRS